MSRTSVDRRRFLSGSTAALIALLTGSILAPAIAFVTSPLWRRRGSSGVPDDFSDAGPVASIPAGTWTLLPIEIVRQDGWDKTRQARSIWVFVAGSAPADVKVLSPLCPHLGCPIAWMGGKLDFFCPCHGSVFNNDGTFVSGPSPRGMDTLEAQIRDGHLWVRWQDFRTGVKDKIAVEV
jgi:menaquinol-cytochrome c reductase iron-sulfur subunit